MNMSEFVDPMSLPDEVLRNTLLSSRLMPASGGKHCETTSPISSVTQLGILGFREVSQRFPF
jgi:hypothetical protein